MARGGCCGWGGGGVASPIWGNAMLYVALSGSDEHHQRMEPCQPPLLRLSEVRGIARPVLQGGVIPTPPRPRFGDDCQLRTNRFCPPPIALQLFGNRQHGHCNRCPTAGNCRSQCSLTAPSASLPLKRSPGDRIVNRAKDWAQPRSAG